MSLRIIIDTKLLHHCLDWLAWLVQLARDLFDLPPVTRRFHEQTKNFFLQLLLVPRLSNLLDASVLDEPHEVWIKNDLSQHRNGRGLLLVILRQEALLPFTL